ncbi:hypothetical protein JG687_00008930 [Phytophthora cactorum]|uniref:Uncharacterized protein n=1 Tax=Phytophthora cactorum TaxID=29920 RepID=A0A8T1UDI6_9STRA|nr:hypothetical protein JG687_00008930 [Phytophthora cactorum]
MIATVQHVMKTQNTFESPMDVEIEEVYSLPSSDKVESENGKGGCLKSFGQWDAGIPGAANTVSSDHSHDNLLQPCRMALCTFDAATTHFDDKAVLTRGSSGFCQSRIASGMKRINYSMTKVFFVKLHLRKRNPVSSSNIYG